jgi:hypothetical protein
MNARASEVEIRGFIPHCAALHAGYFSFTPQSFAAARAVPMQRFRGSVI